ncbi:MAG: hypothetical protein K2X81_12030, partial [Candidatus Obscuribacterales bacterium]|nr:hypothetical protein [Candidatus Obscuribacterales bacterium]
RRAELNEQCEELRACREALKIYFAKLKESLLDKRIKILHDEWVRLEANIQREEENIARLKNDETQIRRSIAENGGDRIERLAIEIQQKQNEYRTRKSKFDRYSELLHQIGLGPAQDESGFYHQQKIQESENDLAKNRETEVQNELVEATVRFREGKLENDELEKEIKSLKSRRSNIPLMQIGLRDDLCKALRLKEDDLPFVGELLQIREDEKDWEGAAERLLRNFGLSLIVPDVHYAAVSDWVDRTHLKGRMVYYRVKGKVPGDLPVMEASSLAKKIDIKPDSPYFDWLERELAMRFDIACCDSPDEFRRRSRAISINGQVKMPGERHEKDDRHRIDDRSRFILGWTNTAKIFTLENQLKSLQSRLASIASKMSDLQAEQRQLAGRLAALARLEEYKDFRELDWQSISIEVARLEHEKKELETASDVLKQLSETLNAVLKEIIESDKSLLDSRDKRSKTEQKQSDAQSAKDDIKLQLDDPSNAEHLRRFDKLEIMRLQALGEHTLTVESCANREQDLRGWLQSQIDSVDRKLRELRERIVSAMTKYKTDFPLETQEVDASVESAGEFEAMLKKLQEDDLPRWESRFKELLNENTIREVANFQSQLTRERETIKERISQINGSLTQIDYNPGRYIELEAQLSQDADIRQFQQELRSCTEGSFTGSDDAQYSESKFLQVKAIIERFRGREGQTDLDKKWTQRVTDVRNWFTFGASERWHEDKSEHEHYSDSSGKSGGQKEKLAYTILAASLAYQFGLAWGETRSRTFRFVVIDEAFGRGSDDSAQYGLKLFERLNLQLLVVTPLQKIHIIEPFVRNVGFVHNDGGSSSRLRNLTIEEYHAEKTRLSQ